MDSSIFPSHKAIPNVEAPCPLCGAHGPYTLGPGAGPWHAQLLCRCGQRLRWLSRYQAKQYRIAQHAPYPVWRDTTMALAFKAAMQRQGVER